MGEWTVDTLRVHVCGQVADLKGLLDERYGTQTVALDKAFAAQQTAMHTALKAALRATDKAAIVGDKHAEAIHEFRGQLSEQGKALADLTAGLSNLRSRYAGVSVALGVIMTVLIVLVTVVGLVK